MVARVCEVCGHALPVAEAPEAPVAPLLDLEAVSVASPGPELGPPLLELEPTRFAPTVAPESWSEGEWERSQPTGVPDVAAGGLVDLDSGREAPAERTPPTLGPMTCRYCRNVQASGLLCERCGLRLPWGPALGGVARAPEAELLVRCQACGERTYPHERCSSCGSVLALEV